MKRYKEMLVVSNTVEGRREESGDGGELVTLYQPTGVYSQIRRPKAQSFNTWDAAMKRSS